MSLVKQGLYFGYPNSVSFKSASQQKIACSNSTIETIQKGVKYFQS